MTRRKLGFVLALLCAMLSSFTLAYATSDGDTIYLGPAPAEEEIKLDIQEETLPETAAAAVETDHSYLLSDGSLLVDDAGLLSASEKQALLKKLEAIKAKNFELVIVTKNSIGGRNVESYVDDFYDANGYGYGEKRDGAILLLSMAERDWAIGTTGFGITALTDAGQAYIMDKVLGSLSSGDYAKAFTTFADLTDQFVDQARTGAPYDTWNMPKGTVSPFWIFGDAVIGMLAALVPMNAQKRRLHTVTTRTEAADYAVSGSFKLNNSSENFVGAQVRTIMIPRARTDGGNVPHSGGTGSSIHVGSSGTTHGGSHGKF